MRLSRQSCLLIALCFCLFPASVRAAQECFPWRKGTVWTYQAKVDWVANDTKEIKSAEIKYDVTVVDTYASGNIRAARLRGFIFDLAWYQPDHLPADCLLVQIGPNHLFFISDDVKKIWPALVAGTLDDYFPRLDNAELLLEMPLTENARWGDLAHSPGDRYCCIVGEGVSFDLSSLPGAPALPHPREFSITCHTNPDDSDLKFVPGLGISAYTYHHHGTVSNVEARLIKYSP